MIKCLFWFSILIVFYVYLGYPIVVFILSLFLSVRSEQKDSTPFVTILIAAYNEADHIEKTIRNKLALDYPSDQFELIVISDESTDGTDEIVNNMRIENVRLIRQSPRAGKTSALNLAVSQAKGEILVFSDANSIYDVAALKKLVANFADPKIGYVTGKMIYVNPEGTPVGDGCSAYMKYENRLRADETKLGSIVGVDGGIDAVRKELYEPMRSDQLPDFVLPLKVVEKGFRVVYEPDALLKENTLKDASDEYRMRVRVALRAIWALFDMRELLFMKPGNRLFSWQLWSHKVLRYLGFLFILMAFLANIVLLTHGAMYVCFFILQIAAIGGAIAFPFLEKRNQVFLPLRFLNYFFLLNLASAHAFLKFIMGKKQVLWTPRKG